MKILIILINLCCCFVIGFSLTEAYSQICPIKKVYNKIIWVGQIGHDANPGTESFPLRNQSLAISKTKPGDLVIIIR